MRGDISSTRESIFTDKRLQRLEVFPPHRQIAKTEIAGEIAALCTVVSTKGSTPRKPGAKMLVKANGETIGTIGGGQLELVVTENARRIIETKTAKLFTHSLINDHGMCCGGSLQIFIEPISGMNKLYIFGAGHIGKSLATFAMNLSFKVSLVDPRPEMFDHISNKNIETVNLSHRRAFEELSLDENTFIVVVTHDHAIDREIVAHFAKQPHAYLGMIGSQRKVELAKKAFLAGKILSEEEMADIDWPMGIDMKVVTPEEIAVSILAKLIDIRNKLA